MWSSTGRRHTYNKHEKIVLPDRSAHDPIDDVLEVVRVPVALPAELSSPWSVVRNIVIVGA